MKTWNSTNHEMPYVYQPFGVLSNPEHAAYVRLWGVGLGTQQYGGHLAEIRGLTRAEAEAVREALVKAHREQQRSDALKDF